MNRLFFILFSNCKPVRGQTGTLIYDLQLYRIKLVPNLLNDILFENKGLSIIDLHEKYPDYKRGLNKYIKVLVKEGYGLLTEYPELFPPLSLHWEYPGGLTNAILDIDAVYSYDIKSTLEELISLNCQVVQFRLYFSPSLEDLNTILKDTVHSRIKSIELLIPYSKKFHGKLFLRRLERNHPRIKYILFHNIKTDKYIPYSSERIFIQYSKKNIDYDKHCGAIKNNFYVNLQMFTESQYFNTCLNMKIVICRNGDIKNCSSMYHNFGNINKISIKQVLLLESFKKLWLIKKDDILICKNCEFRYMCVDCRAFIRDQSNIFSKPSKCDYNPLIGKWYGEDGYEKESQLS